MLKDIVSAEPLTGYRLKLMKMAAKGLSPLFPIDKAYDGLADDYDRMLDNGVLLDDEELLEDIVWRGVDSEAGANDSVE